MTPTEFQRICLLTEKTPSYVVDVHGALGPKGEVSQTMSRLDHAARGMVTEAGEIIDALKKHSCYGKTLDLVNLKEEVGDVLWYASVMLDALGLTFEDAMEATARKLKKRYPNGFTQEAALNRDLEAEKKALEGSE